MTADTGQQDAQAEAGDPASTGPTPPEPPASEARPAGDAEQSPGVGDQDDDADDQGDQGDQGGRRNREAQYRRRAQAAEAERDQLRGQLDTLHRQIVGGIATAHGLPEVGLLESAGHELSSFIADDGQVKAPELIEAVQATISRYNITPKSRPRPNGQQGSYGTPAGGSGLKDVLKTALGR